MAEFKVQRQNEENGGNKEICRDDFGVGKHKLMIESLKIIFLQSNLLFYILLSSLRFKQKHRKCHFFSNYS